MVLQRGTDCSCLLAVVTWAIWVFIAEKQIRVHGETRTTVGRSQIFWVSHITKKGIKFSQNAKWMPHTEQMLNESKLEEAFCFRNDLFILKINLDLFGLRDLWKWLRFQEETLFLLASWPVMKLNPIPIHFFFFLVSQSRKRGRKRQHTLKINSSSQPPCLHRFGQSLLWIFFYCNCPQWRVYNFILTFKKKSLQYTNKMIRTMQNRKLFILQKYHRLYKAMSCMRITLSGSRNS